MTITSRFTSHIKFLKEDRLVSNISAAIQSTIAHNIGKVKQNYKDSKFIQNNKIVFQQIWTLKSNTKTD